jgi:hypothetical protein
VIHRRGDPRLVLIRLELTPGLVGRLVVWSSHSVKALNIGENPGQQST